MEATRSAHKQQDIATTVPKEFWNVKIFECYYTIHTILHLTETAD